MPPPLEDKPGSGEDDASGPSIAPRAARRPSFKDLDELALFPDDASRHRALKRFEREMMPRTWRHGIRLLAIMFCSLAIPATLAIGTARLLMSPWSTRAATFVMICGYFVIRSFLVRREMPRSLRNQLLDLGVPICVKCGYDQRTLPSATARCPECGRELDPRAIKALQDRARGEGEQA